MKSRVLAVVVVAGLGVVGYAVYRTTVRPARDSARYAKKGSGAKAKAAPRRKPAESERPPTPEAKSKGSEPQRPPAKAPAKAAPDPGPDMTLDEARKGFDDFMAELDEAIDRQKLSGSALTDEDWNDYKRRGHAVIDRMLHKLDHTKPEHLEELERRQTLAGKKLKELEPAS